MNSYPKEPKEKCAHVPIIICTHSLGNNAGNIHFVWRVPATNEKVEVFSQSQGELKRLN